MLNLTREQIEQMHRIFAVMDKFRELKKLLDALSSEDWDLFETALKYAKKEMGTDHA